MKINEDDILHGRFNFLRCEPLFQTFVKKDTINAELATHQTFSSNGFKAPEKILDSNGNFVGYKLKWNNQTWSIDKRYFASKSNKPPISITLNDPPEKGWDYVIKLSNALFPGTNISADLTCKLKKLKDKCTPNDWEIDLTLFQNDGNVKRIFNATVDLYRWLNREIQAKSTLEFKKIDLCKLGDTLKVELNEDGLCSFSPDWKINLVGNEITIKDRRKKFFKFYKSENTDPKAPKEEWKANNITITLLFPEHKNIILSLADPLAKKNTFDNK